MEVTYSALKQKDVINLTDGKNMGKVCDLTFTFPDNDVTGFTVTGCKVFKFSKQEVFIPVKCVVKIGRDAVLVKFGKEDEGRPPKPERPPFPPDCPPGNRPPNCPPPNCPPDRPPQGRRSYEEYE